MIPDLQNYITQSRQQGMTDDQIRQNLVGQGWGEGDINMAFQNKNRNLSQLERNTLRVLLVLAFIPVLEFFARPTSYAGDKAGLGYYIFFVLPFIIIGLAVTRKFISKPDKASKAISNLILIVVGLIDLVIVVNIVSSL